MAIPSFLPASPPSAVTVDSGWFEGQLGVATGNLYYVQSTSVNASDKPGNGLTPMVPFKTLNFALAQCSPNNGDRIYCLYGHVETVAGAAGLNFSAGVCDGVTVLFEGNEADRATINFVTSTAAQVVIAANNVTLIMPRFTCAIDALVTAVSVTGSDCKIYDARYYDGAALATTIQLATTNAAKRLTIVGWYYFEGTTGTAKTEAIRIVGGDHHRISQLNIVGTFSTSNFNNVTTATTVLFAQAWYLVNLSAAGVATSSFVSTSTFVGADSSNTALGASGEFVVQGGIKTLPASGTQTLFTNTGPIFVTQIVGICTTVVQAQATTFKFSAKVGALTAVDVCATGDLTGFAAGGVISPITTFATALVVASPNTLGVMDQSSAKATAFIMGGTGIITCTTVATSTGAFQYTLRYKPLSANSTVVAN